MNKSTYNTLSTTAATIQRRFDFIFKAMKLEHTSATEEANHTSTILEPIREATKEETEEDTSVRNPIAPTYAENEPTVEQKKQNISKEDVSVVEINETPIDFEEMLKDIVKITSPP